MENEQIVQTSESVAPTFERDERGLVKGIKYLYKKDGTIDWRAMIKPEHLVINKQKREEVEKKYGKSISELDITQLEDKYLLILLAGIKELARLRGYVNVNLQYTYVGESKASSVTHITWIPNFENSSLTTFGDGASATTQNTGQGYENYLEAISANRSFVRAVRNFLGINITGNDEIKSGDAVVEESNSSSSSPISPTTLLQKAANEAKLNLDLIKKGVMSKYLDKIEGNPEKWLKFEDISARDSLFLLSIIKEKISAKS